jgi:predicted phosphodiesterase
VFDGARVGMIHAPGAASHRLSRLRAAFPRCQAVIYGHTHMPEHDEHEGFQIFNPGSPTERRRAPVHTMGVADIADGAVTFELQVLG